MHWRTVLYTVAVAVGVVDAAQQGHTPNFVSFRPPIRRPASPNTVTGNVAPLIQVRGKKGAAKLSQLHLATHKGADHGQNPIYSRQEDLDYVTPLKFGNTTFFAIVDTGSSDTWVVEDNFTCIDYRLLSPTSQAACGFGTLFKPGPTFSRVPDQHFDITYGDNTFGRGLVGRETVSFAGIKVVNQVVGVVNYTSWRGDGSNSGILGLAFPSITNAYRSGKPSTDEYRVEYNPVFTNIYQSKQIDPVFSIALKRNATGILAIGGIPDLNLTTQFARTPFQLEVLQNVPVPTTFQYYGINISTVYSPPGQKASNTTTTPPYTAIIDSGTTLSYFPYELAGQINGLFDPPAEEGFGAEYTVECTAKAPTLGIKIQDHVFYFDERDMIFKAPDGTCVSSIAAAYNGPSILGDNWMKSVLSVFDVGAGEMRFAEWEYD